MVAGCLSAQDTKVDDKVVPTGTLREKVALLRARSVKDRSGGVSGADALVRLRAKNF